MVKMFRACEGVTEKSSGGRIQSGVNRGGPRVLITGGAGGVGTMAIQLAKVLYNASFVCCTASPGAKTELCKELGADAVANYREKNWVEQLVREQCEGWIAAPTTTSTTSEQEQSSVSSPDGGADHPNPPVGGGQTGGTCRRRRPTPRTPTALFDIILDCTGDAPSLVPLLNESCPPDSVRKPTIVSILAAPTLACLSAWVSEAKLDPATVTPGVYKFLTSETLAEKKISSGLLEFFTGAGRMKGKLSENQAFKHVIGVGDGEIMAILARELGAKNVRAVVDKVFALKESVAAIEYQKAGRCAGKVVVRVSASDAGDAM